MYDEIDDMPDIVAEESTITPETEVLGDVGDAKPNADTQVVADEEVPTIVAEPSAIPSMIKPEDMGGHWE